MRFLLDTNAVIALLNDPDSNLAKRAKQHSPADIGMSAIVIFLVIHLTLALLEMTMMAMTMTMATTLRPALTCRRLKKVRCCESISDVSELWLITA